MRQALAKCSKISSMLHTSTKFREAFEAVYGDRGIPQMNDTRWNSMMTHIEGILKLTKTNLCDLLVGVQQENLKFRTSEWSQLEELASILKPFVEATNFTQGQKVRTLWPLSY